MVPLFLQAQSEPLPSILPVADELGNLLLVSPELETGADDAADPVAEPVVMLMTTGDRQHAGRWQVAPHMEITVTFDDNIFIQSENKVADFIFTLAPGIAVGWWDSEERLDYYLSRDKSASLLEVTQGNFIVFDCTAYLLGFARTSSQNALDGDARLQAQWQSEKLTLGGAIHVESRSETNRDIGGRLRQTVLEAEITTRYSLTDKTALEAGLFHRRFEPENNFSSEESRVETFLDFTMTPMLRLGLGGALGVVEVEEAENDVFQRVLGRVSHSWADSLETVLVGGVEFRQAEGSGGDQTNPIFGLQTAWSDGGDTRLAISAFRRIEPSAAQREEDFLLTGFDLAIRRSMAAGVQMSLDGGYNRADYTSIRADDFFYLRPGLLYNFSPWGNLALFWEFRRNRSSVATSSFENNRVSLRFGVIY